MEWNGKFRDTVRDYWRGEPATLDEFAYRLTGWLTSMSAPPGVRSRRSISSLPTTDSRCETWCRTTKSTTRPTAKATATARDNNKRGTAVPKGRPIIPRSTPCGRDNNATSWRPLMLSQGVPMISHGDELGRNEGGNNNGHSRTMRPPGALGQGRQRPARVRAEGIGAAGRSSGVSPKAVLRRVSGAPQGRRGAARHFVVPARRLRDERRRLGDRLRQVIAVF